MSGLDAHSQEKDTFMVKTYHVNFADRMENALITTLLRAGVKMGTTSLHTCDGSVSRQATFVMPS